MSSFVTMSILAGLLAIDDRAGWQSLLAQPVLASVVIGVLSGQPTIALMVGLILELIWLSILPMRGLRRPDHIAGAVVGVGTAVLIANLTADPRTAFITATGIAIGLVAGEVGARVTIPLYGAHSRALGRVGFKDSESLTAITRKLILLGTASHVVIFLIEAVVVFLLLAGGFWTGEWFTRHVGGRLVDGIAAWFALMPAFGVASLVHLHWQSALRRVLVLGMVVAVLVLWIR